MLEELKKIVDENITKILKRPSVDWILGDNEVAQAIVKITDPQIVGAVEHIREQWNQFEKMKENSDTMVNQFFLEAGVDHQKYIKEQGVMIAALGNDEKPNTPETDKFKAWREANPEKAKEYKKLSSASFDLLTSEEPFEDFVKNFFTKITEYEGQKTLA